MPARKGRPRVFDDPEMRASVLRLVSEGMGRKEACDHLGVSYPTMYRYVRDHAEFRLELEDAEGVIRESARKVLIDLMHNADRDADRQAAAKTILQDVQREQKVTAVEHTHKHELSAGPEVLEIVELQRQLQERALSAGSVEGHVLDLEDD